MSLKYGYLKKNMFQSFFGWYSFSWIVYDHFLEQIQRLLVEIRAQLFQISSFEFRERFSELRQFSEVFPRFFCWRTVELKNFEYLVYFRVSTEKTFCLNFHFCEPAHRKYSQLTKYRYLSNTLSCLAKFQEPYTKELLIKCQQTSWVSVLIGSPKARANPKSANLTVPSSPTSKFCGFRSRCKIRMLCR